MLATNKTCITCSTTLNNAIKTKQKNIKQEVKTRGAALKTTLLEI